jgi:hypothetical protein
MNSQSPQPTPGTRTPGTSSEARPDPPAQDPRSEQSAELDRELDRELDDTFPASDPLPWSHEVK